MISVHLGGDASCTTICDPGQTLVELILDRTWQYLRYLLISWELLLYKTEGARKSFGDVIADGAIAQPLLWKNVPPPQDSCLSFSMSVPADTYDGAIFWKWMEFTPVFKGIFSMIDKRSQSIWARVRLRTCGVTVLPTTRIFTPLRTRSASDKIE